MNFRFVSIVGITGAMLASEAYSADCRARAIAVNREVVISQFLPIPLFVPQYSFGYGPGYGVNDQQLRADVEKLKADVARLQAELHRMGGNVNPGPVAAPPKEIGKHMGIFAARCAACHDAKVSAGKGASFTLLDGDKLAPLTDRQVNRMISLIYSGKMPKGKEPLSDTEVSSIMEWVEARSAKPALEIVPDKKPVP